LIKIKNCAIFGGTFDPIHLGHLLVIDKLIASEKFDTITVVPSGNPVLRKAVAPAQDRLEMVKLAIQGRKIEVSDCEIKREGASFAIDTAKEIQELHPDSNLYWVIGSDAFVNISQWHQIGDLAQLVEFLVIERPGSPRATSEFRSSFWQINALPISATDIRNRIRDGNSVKSLLPDAVFEYAMSKDLYGAA
jgi:nicotinate-nucleotide adenylyltransferase